ncbi:LytTR family DNA-binding domain-containing protein [Blastomonas sp. SL216]|uniref:LytTR family DNA-binding domain-containing protein n=1 Tax=Blastomonas sp. SL216 TaxID=2995169 RepID=UPI002377CBD8|nr:LytTR family DNA-binding domain-containing protein [Blastomonas sp. SL216]
MTTALIWQASSFGTWIPVAWLLSRLTQSRRCDERIVAGALTLGLVVIPLQATVTALLDASFSPTSVLPLVSRWTTQLPVSTALYTGVMAIVAALAWRRRAAAEQARNARMQQALARARTAASRASAKLGVQAASLLVSEGSRQVPVDLNRAEWFGSAANYVVVNWEGREGLVRRTLRSIEEELDAAIFARCHRTAIVNLAMVLHATLLSDGTWRLTMQSGSEVAVSRTYRDVILDRLGAAKA